MTAPSHATHINPATLARQFQFPHASHGKLATHDRLNRGFGAIFSALPTAPRGIPHTPVTGNQCHPNRGYMGKRYGERGSMGSHRNATSGVTP